MTPQEGLLGKHLSRCHLTQMQRFAQPLTEFRAGRVMFSQKPHEFFRRNFHPVTCPSQPFTTVASRQAGLGDVNIFRDGNEPNYTGN